MIDFNVVLIDLNSEKVREVVTVNDDGTYTIFIQNTLSFEQQQEECKHAIEHIYNDDFNRNISVDVIEIEAHQIA